MAREFKLPDLGEGLAEAEIVRVLVSEGDLVREDQIVLEVETDKAQVELPSPFAGRVGRVHVREGERVPVGAVLLSFDGGEGEAGARERAPARAEDREPPRPSPVPEPRA
ncbi:MAG: 2-oxo acid dehydrogenase subunit E2, partial [Candidatus Rokubacteria bacterium]|nr:2-oxo acid dehydrogenase subunit E2 [Candidatus Rokubacteria bacterium]